MSFWLSKADRVTILGLVTWQVVESTPAQSRLSQPQIKKTLTILWIEHVSHKAQATPNLNSQARTVLVARSMFTSRRIRFQMESRRSAAKKTRSIVSKWSTKRTCSRQDRLLQRWDTNLRVITATKTTITLRLPARLIRPIQKRSCLIITAGKPAAPRVGHSLMQVLSTLRKASNCQIGSLNGWAKNKRLLVIGKTRMVISPLKTRIRVLKVTITELNVHL